MNELRLGVVGAGRHSQRRLLPAVSRLDNICLAAVCDLDETRAGEAAHRFGAKQVYRDYHEMFASAQLDAVAICVGPEEHAKISVDALHAGLHVYTEKPPALSAESAWKIMQVSRQTGLICMTGFKKRFAPAIRQAHKIVHSPEFGTPAMLSVWRSAGPFEHLPEQPTTWFLLDMGIHTIDLVRYLFGEVSKVSAWSKGVDSFAIQLRFANTALGLLSLCARQSWATCSELVEITSEARQFIRVENGISMEYYERDTIRSLYRPNFSFSGGDSLYETGFVPEMAEFIEAIRAKRQPLSDIESGYHTMLLYEAIRDSALQDGRTIDLPPSNQKLS